MEETSRGASTDLIRSDLDAVEAFNDLIGIAESFAGGDVGLPLIEGSSAEQLENAVEEATIEIYTGSEDRFLRRLVIDVDFGIKDRAGAPEDLTQLAGARMLVEMEIADPKRPGNGGRARRRSALYGATLRNRLTQRLHCFWQTLPSCLTIDSLGGQGQTPQTGR